MGVGMRGGKWEGVLMVAEGRWAGLFDWGDWIWGCNGRRMLAGSSFVT